MRHALLACLLLSATGALAQPAADLAVAIGLGQTVDAARDLQWTVDVINNGPGDARNAALTVSSDPPLGTTCNVETIELLTAGSRGTFFCTTRALRQTGDVVLHAHIAYDNDPNPKNNDDTKTFHMVASVDAGVVVLAPTIEPSLPFDLGIALFNGGALPATGVTVTIGLPAHVQVVSLPGNCKESSEGVTCSAPDIPPITLFDGHTDFGIRLAADDSTNGQPIPISAAVHTTETNTNPSPGGTLSVPVFRTFFVTQATGDALGAAIDQANLACTDEYPCKVAFRLGTPPASGYFTIRPVNALPKLTGKDISIDGTTQTRLTGDTNPNGPEIFIDGSASTSEDAIVVDQLCGVEVAGLAIGNFANAAVSILGKIPDNGQLPCTLGSTRAIHDNYLGVAPSGTQPAPNGRGVVLTISANVTNNVIGANRRSGIWVQGPFRENISGNRIGLDINNEPLGNGASGIYIGPNTVVAEIHGNYVAFNHDFGIAVDRSATYIGIGPNSIFANWQLGIDIGLDGPTPNRDIPAPAVLSAQYDPVTNTTVITSSSNEVRHAPNIFPILTMYASDAPHPSGYGDGQYYLGSIAFDSTKGNIVFAAAGDWRGKWVSATMTRTEIFEASFPFIHDSTSEFSKAVQVQ